MLKLIAMIGLGIFAFTSCNQANQPGEAPIDPYTGRPSVSGAAEGTISGNVWIHKSGKAFKSVQNANNIIVVLWGEKVVDPCLVFAEPDQKVEFEMPNKIGKVILGGSNSAQISDARLQSTYAVKRGQL